MEDCLLKVVGLSKRFTLNNKKVNAPSLKRILRTMIGLNEEVVIEDDYFWALKEVSFSINRGENIGIVGLNGAGKSTLLKLVLNRFPSDSGVIERYGSVGGLVELGAGFNPELTGLQNIYQSSKLHGISKSEVDAKLPSIIDFSELAEFIDMPV